MLHRLSIQESVFMKKIPKVVLMIENSRQAGHNLLRGVAKYARIHGPWDFFRQTPYYLGDESFNHFLNRLREWEPDGIIARDFEKSEKLLEFGVPTVLTMTYKDGIPCKYTCIDDFEKIASFAADHLLERGFKNFAFCGYDKTIWSRNRGSSFESYLRDKGYSCAIYDQPAGMMNQPWEKEKPILTDWLKKLPLPLGVMACNDERAQDVIDSCRECGFDIPDDVAVIGVDNDPLLCELKNPQITSVALNAERSGFEIAELLDSLMKNRKIDEKTIVTAPTHIESRQSTDRLAIDDEEVSMAIKYIRDHSKELIQVEDVLEVVPLSRRALERRFKKVLKRTVYDEIQQAKMNEICHLLVKTNYSITRIAMILGYCGVAHFARAFTKIKGISPLAYRKKYGRT
jgi:LacI family transcriptional regulator